MDKDEAAAVKSGEGVARVAAKTSVEPGNKLTFVVNIEDMQFPDTLRYEDGARHQELGGT